VVFEKRERIMRVRTSNFKSYGNLIVKTQKNGFEIIKSIPRLRKREKFERLRIRVVNGNVKVINRYVNTDIEHTPYLLREISRLVTPVFGFITSKDYEPKKTGESHPRRGFATRPYFFNYKEPKEESFDVLSISFEEPKMNEDESFWYSLLYATLEGASQALE